jgi:hypothetical protein
MTKGRTALSQKVVAGQKGLLLTRSFVHCKQKCHPDRSEAKWRDLLFIIRIIKSE